jgi:hypothetical protein
MTATRRNRVQLGVEALETRTLLTAAPILTMPAAIPAAPVQVTAQYDATAHKLIVTGTAGDDKIYVKQMQGAVPIQVATDKSFAANTLVAIANAPAGCWAGPATITSAAARAWTS